MAVDKTVKGGAFQNPDGSWVDANGKPLKGEPAGLKELQAENEKELEEARAAQEQIARNQARALGLAAPVASMEYARPEEPVDEDDKAGARKVSKKKG